MTKHPDVVVLADADNTLWDTDARFAKAQLRLLDVIELHVDTTCEASDRLGFVRAYDQAVAKEHHLHLRYPVWMLAEALAMGLRGDEPEKTAKALVHRSESSAVLPEAARNDAIQAFTSTLSTIPELLPGVVEGLELARARGATVYVVTEGNAEAQRNILKHHALSELITGVSEVTKNEAQFARIRKRYGNSDIAMIGDQPSRDIAPAHAAGCTTVLVPSRFRPAWDSFDERGDADYVAIDFMHAMRWVLSRADSVH